MENSLNYTGRPRILIIDDEIPIREMLKAALDADFDCETAGCAEEVYNRLAEQSFDIVLSDIDLGCGTTGNDLVPKIRSISPETVVVMVSGNQGIDNAILAMQAGAFDFIKKPFELSYLDVVMRRALEHHELLKEKRLYEEHLEELIRQRTDQLNYLSFFDPLTDLPNRALFEDRASQAIRSPEGIERTALMLISIDGFRKVRETYGHSVSDVMLVETAKRLGTAVGAIATVSRYERDEFAVLLNNFETEEELGGIARGIAEAVRCPFLIENNEMVVTCSVGISISRSDGSELIMLMRNATAALAKAKEQGGDAVRFYTADMNARALKRFTLETGMCRALERGEFDVFYQPKIDISSGCICGMEALVRWQHPEIGMVSPGEFIPLAEETGLIIPLGEAVLRKAVRQTQIWRDLGYDLEIAINLSARQIQHNDLAASVIAIINEIGFQPRFLNLEITESSVIDNGEEAQATLWALKKAGITISLDDFGTGYSSLSYLKKLPIDVLKIDRSFVSELPDNADDAALTVAIITLGHNLRLKVVAEGVETEEQLEFLRSKGCDEYQGFLFAKPLSAPDFELLLNAKSTIGRYADRAH